MELNSLEISILFWVGVFAALVAIKVPLKPVAEIIRTIIYSKPLRNAVIIILMWIAIEFLILIYFGLDITSQIKNICLWFITVPFSIPVRLQKNKNNSPSSIVSEVILDNFKVSTVIELVTSTYTISTLIQIPITGFVLLISVGIAVSALKQEHLGVKIFLERILTIIFLIVLTYSLWKFYANPNELFQIKTLRDYLFPIFLSVLYLPIGWGIFVYVSIEDSLARLSLYSDKAVYNYAFKRSFFEFFFHPNLSKRWRKMISLERVKTKEDIDELIINTIKAQDKEVLPNEVLLTNGWSPVKARLFLISKKLEIPFYTKLPDDEIYYSSSNFLYISDGPIPNAVIYWIEGEEDYVTSLTLRLSIYNFDEISASIITYMEAVQILIKDSLASDLTNELFDAIAVKKDMLLVVKDKYVRLDIREYSIAAHLLEIKLTISNAIVSRLSE